MKLVEPAPPWPPAAIRPAGSRANLAFRADSDLVQLDALGTGFGIGICQVALAAKTTRWSCSSQDILSQDGNLGSHARARAGVCIAPSPLPHGPQD